MGRYSDASWYRLHRTQRNIRWASPRLADGTVLAVLDMVAYGKTVVLNHGEQISTVYAHLGRVSVETGDVVVVGDPLGTVGSTGLSTGIHLHFELRVNGTAKDPVPYLNFPAAPPAEP